MPMYDADVIMMMTMILMINRKENDVLPLHNIENGEDHCDDEENGHNDANGPSGIRLHW